MLLKRKMNNDTINIISLGAGRQSVYMLIQALENQYDFYPDYAVFADTKCERKKVYDYLSWLKKHIKYKYNFEITTVSKGDLIKDTIDFIAGNIKKCENIPLKLEAGGIMQRRCTYHYKIAPIRKFAQSVRKGKKVKMYIGISTDEYSRMRKSDVQYIENNYPLIDNKINLSNIINWYEKTGFPKPVRSSCLICPFHKDSYWTNLKKTSPKEFEKACKFDDMIRNYPNLKSKAYLSRHLKPLRKIYFESEPSLFSDCV